MKNYTKYRLENAMLNHLLQLINKPQLLINNLRTG